MIVHTTLTNHSLNPLLTLTIAQPTTLDGCTLDQSDVTLHTNCLFIPMKCESEISPAYVRGLVP